MARFCLTTLILLITLCTMVVAQDDEIPLGDLARALRKAKAASSEERPVIDNDNLPVMMEKAESERLNGKPVFSVDPSGKTFRMTSPDGSCSISFDAKATALISVPYVASELPQDELGKLEGTATIRDGVLEVSMHNGTGWELKEMLVGITTVENQSRPQVEATALETDQPEMGTKLPDVTTLYHLKASAPPDSFTVFQGNLPADWEQAKEWHWAVLGARGIPPAAPANPGTEPPAFASTPLLGPQPSDGQPSQPTAPPAVVPASSNTAGTNPAEAR